MTKTGAYPPGCTQADVDRAAPGYDDPPEEPSELELVYEDLYQAQKSLRMRKDARADLIDLLERVVEYMKNRADADCPPGRDYFIANEEMRLQMDAEELLTRSWDDRY